MPFEYAALRCSDDDGPTAADPRSRCGRVAGPGDQSPYVVRLVNSRVARFLSRLKHNGTTHKKADKRREMRQQRCSIL